MARKVLYFIAGDAPTVAEAAQIANIVGDVQIRSAKFDTTYGGRLEPANALAGSIPAAYKTASGNTIVDTALYPGGDVTPLQGGYGLTIIPVNPGGIAANAGTKQLYALRTSLDEATGAVTVTDVTTACAWSSATTAKGTVDASTGLVTGANGGAGTSVITASYDPDGGSGEAAVTATTTATFV
jgi:hypothetical protein